MIIAKKKASTSDAGLHSVNACVADIGSKSPERACHAWIRLARTLEHLSSKTTIPGLPGEYDAITCLEKAVEADSTVALAHLKLGHALGKKATDGNGFKARQVKCYLTAKDCSISTNRTKSDAWTALGKLLKEGITIPELGGKATRDCFIQAVNADKENVVPLLLLARELSDTEGVPLTLTRFPAGPDGKASCIRAAVDLSLKSPDRRDRVQGVLEDMYLK